MFVDTEGSVYDLEENEIERKMGSSGYSIVMSVHLHVLVAETYLGYKAGSGLTVNHKDGDKSYCAVDNLEVVSYSENSLHAYQTGLRPDNIRVLVKDLRSGVVSTFFSMNECGRAFEVNTFQINWALDPKRRGKVWKKFYLIIREDESWPDYKQEDVGKTLNGYYKNILVVDTLSNVREVHQGFSELARRTGIKPNTLRERFHKVVGRGGSVVVVDGLSYRVMNDDEHYPDLPYIKAEWKHAVPVRQPKRVAVIENDTATIYKSLKEFCEKHGFSYDAVSKSVHKKNSYKQFEIKYLHRPPSQKRLE